ncbi:hypothetical protein SPRG_05869 [Saprolegnia parasitica CBS 223.65]|uniref:EF-hand domain-containing protein n=1 Tax=Saprolegnia parasitica (strain CBS 223.65) TaxID=695850 RepID=A0A067CFR7_SAPPC|nr:hypothetical protein SPRG_05869 [Saprolegnia parasitica CBS 223.65]KDO29333.1 hypothetical protein SPRG_05869 [Saprolegnia parasitica CBS 223.65]|eukprot:XP_012199836.1 hypothetical protein SPRG_05869 [Saprolegnia parasitica CBS 223.65]
MPHAVVPHGQRRLGGPLSDETVRVFNVLATAPLRQKLQRLEADGAQATHHDTNAADGETKRHEEINRLRGELVAMSVTPSGAISTAGLAIVCKELQLALTKAEIERVIWEVDEDMDGRISFAEFSAMLERCSRDKHGLEPCQLIPLVEFLSCDPSATPHRVSLDELCKRRLRRSATVELEKRLRTLDTHGDNSISLQMYWDTINADVPKPVT